jgi:hypothetical protein
MTADSDAPSKQTVAGFGTIPGQRELLLHYLACLFHYQTKDPFNNDFPEKHKYLFIVVTNVYLHHSTRLRYCVQFLQNVCFPGTTNTIFPGITKRVIFGDVDGTIMTDARKKSAASQKLREMRASKNLKTHELRFGSSKGTAPSKCKEESEDEKSDGDTDDEDDEEEKGKKTGKRKGAGKNETGVTKKLKMVVKQKVVVNVVELKVLLILKVLLQLMVMLQKKNKKQIHQQIYGHHKIIKQQNNFQIQPNKQFPFHLNK